MKSYNNWILAKDDEHHCITLTLNRPERLNVFDLDSLNELVTITDVLEKDDSVWSVIVTGEGSHFSAGMDTDILAKITEVSESDFRLNMKQMQECFDRFENIKKPTIAKIKGFCMGAGFMFSLCCDFRIASEKSIFAMPLVKLGLTVLMGTQRISRLAGLQRTKEIVYFAEKFNAKKAFDYGLLNQVVAPDELDKAAIKLAEKFTKLAPATIGITKQVINQGIAMTLRESEDLEIDLQSTLLDSPDLAVAMRSYLDNTKPVFTGR